MRVKELIEKLKEMPEDDFIQIVKRNGRYREIEYIRRGLNRNGNANVTIIKVASKDYS